MTMMTASSQCLWTLYIFVRPRARDREREIMVNKSISYLNFTEIMCVYVVDGIVCITFGTCGARITYRPIIMKATLM